jgi:hypothetical protein
VQQAATTTKPPTTPHPILDQQSAIGRGLAIAATL